MDAVNQKNSQKLSNVLSTKLSIDDYNAFVTLTKIEYESGLIKEESTSELLRFTIRHLLNQVHNQPEFLYSNNNNKSQFISNHRFIINMVYRLVPLLQAYLKTEILCGAYPTA